MAKRGTRYSAEFKAQAVSLRGLGRPREVIPLAEEELRGEATNDAKAEAIIVAASALADQRRFPEALAFLGRPRTRQDQSEGYTLRLWYVKTTSSRRRVEPTRPPKSSAT